MNTQNISEIQTNTIIKEDHDGWINLPAWNGFQARNRTYSSIDSEESSDGIIKAHIVGVITNQKYLLSQAQFNAIKYLNENSELVRDSLLNSLLDDYSNTKDIYEELMPEINVIEDYKNYVGVSFLHIMDSEKNGFAYYGFELGCSWDEEHGAGAMMYKDRVIKTGLAEESFNHWNCYEDNGTLEYQQEKWQRDNKINTYRKKWWEFWK
ncbi:hypothetical protein V9L05_10945 [Bernardetia sp. Wsw4-3y2]|uniref:DUF6985 domain-containing protein n=1 Tax=Bernardetia sp. Wsw4-3y2 TaxID=3127471 RepID=UPI0030CBBA32